MKLKPIIPFEPVSSTEVPKGEEWISQIKWDGVRILTYFDGEWISLFNRKLNERTDHYPEITDIFSYFKGKSVILDGEVIALDSNGKPSFHEVMRRDGLRNMDRVKLVINDVPIYYMIFDILYFNGNWIHEQPLEKRLTVLQNCIIPNKYIQIVPSQKEGAALWDVVKQHGLEGIVCKNVKSTYTIDGKDDRWRKVKNYQDVIAVIGGVTYRAGTVNSLLLGLFDKKGQFWYIGHCGTGKMTQTDWKELTENIKPLFVQEKPFENNPERMKGVQWLRPEITVKVQYIEWPTGRTLRQPSIQAFTEVKPTDCLLPYASIEIEESPAENQTQLDTSNSIDLEIDITHPDKPLWETPRVLKKQYIEYLEGVYPYISPFLKNRLLTVIRYPHGIFGEPFYQKNCPDYAPSFIQTSEAEGINYIVCNDKQTFLWLGNQLAFEFHIPFHTINLRGPSEIVLDLDPPSKDHFSLAIKAAIYIKEVLDNLHLTSFVKTSGNKGLQIYIPLPDNRYTYEETRIFTSFIADYLVTKEPDSFTIERMKKNRGNRLYVDYVQHAEGKTIIAPYSPRGNPKATVATPLYWEEVNMELTMEKFQITTLLDRLKTYGNPFETFFQVKQTQNFDPILDFLKNK
jgi:bifunctional non-homologous end joining protein LigD